MGGGLLRSVERKQVCSSKPDGQGRPQWNVEFELRLEQGIMADVDGKSCVHSSKFRQS